MFSTPRSNTRDLSVQFVLARRFARLIAIAITTIAGAKIALSGSTVLAQTAPAKPAAGASTFDPFRLDAPLRADPAVRAGVLANGLHYYIRKNAKPEKRVELRLVVNAGSVREEEDQRGLAHFLLTAPVFWTRVSSFCRISRPTYRLIRRKPWANAVWCWKSGAVVFAPTSAFAISSCQSFSRVRVTPIVCPLVYPASSSRPTLLPSVVSDAPGIAPISRRWSRLVISNPRVCKHSSRKTLALFPKRRRLARELHRRCRMSIRRAGSVQQTVKKGIEPQSTTLMMVTGEAPWTREQAYLASSLGQLLEMRLLDRLREAMGGTYGVSVDASISRAPRQEFQVGIQFGSAQTAYCPKWCELERTSSSAAFVSH